MWSILTGAELGPGAKEAGNTELVHHGARS